MSETEYATTVCNNDGQEVLAAKLTTIEMRSIRCIEHTGKMKFITPFVSAQVEICKAKQATRRRGRPANPKVEKQTY